MNFVESFVLLATGYLSGLSICSGFILSAIHQLYVNGRSRLREAGWISCMAANTIFCALAPVFMIALLVYGAESAEEYFWRRLAIFALGVSLGAAFSFGAVHLINRVIRDKGGKEPA